MRYRLSAAIVVTAVAAVTISAPVLAQVDYGSETPVPVPSDRTGWTLGLGVAAVPDYEGSDDYKAVPVPYINWQGEHRYFNLTGLTAKGNVLGTDIIEFGPRLRVRPKRDDVDNNRVDDMKSTDTAVELGAFVAASYERWRAEFWFSQDVADAYNGQLAGFEGSYTYPINPSWVLKTTFTTTYASGRYMDTYFGVDAEDSQRSGLRQYNASAGFKDVGGDVALTYTGWQHWGLTGVFSYDRLLGDAEDSPVTKEGSANQFIFGALLTYKFGGGS
jgi:outer membrane protein